jgi:hypothetical protein
VSYVNKPLRVCLLLLRRAAEELLREARRAAVSASMSGTATAYSRAFTSEAHSAQSVAAKRLLNNTLLQAARENNRRDRKKLKRPREPST